MSAFILLGRRKTCLRRGRLAPRRMKEEEVQAAQQTENGETQEEVKKDVNKMNIKELKAGKDETELAGNMLGMLWNIVNVWLFLETW